MRLHLACFALAPALLVFGTGCTTPAPKPLPKAAPTAAKAAQTYWQGDGVAGEPSIVVSLAKQRAYFYKAQALVGETVISSGRKGFETPPGSYRVIQKDEKHVSNLYGDFVGLEGTVVKASVDASKEAVPEGAEFRGAMMPYFLRFSGGYGLHAGKVPGHRASHGCVRLPRRMARHFYENAAIGTPVTVE